MGLLVIIGWHSNNNILVQVRPEFVPMQYNTALGFFLCGLLVLTVYLKKNGVSKIVACIVGFIGFVTLIQYIFDVNIGLDEFFIKHSITTNTSHPGRMAPNTAFCFVLIAVATLIHKFKLINLRVSSVLASLVFSLGLMALIGYFTNVESSYGWGRLTHMAAHTAFGFIVVGLGFTWLNWMREQELWKKYEANKQSWVFWLIPLLSLTLFFIDLSLPLGVAAGIPYVLLIMLGWFFKKKRAVINLALTASFLIVLGYFLSEQGGYVWIAITNRVFAIIIIWILAMLLYNIKLKERKLINSNLELDKKVLERTKELNLKNKELKQFAYIASHDLQEPLRTVLSFTELLDTNYTQYFDETGKKSMKFITEAALRMKELIKGLLDFSRIGTNKEKEQVDCNILLSEIQEDLALSITETNTTIQIEALPTINGYKTELRLLFQNLMSNAIKFKKDNVAPQIHIGIKEEENNKTFFVQDNGIGIPDEYKERIFMIFQRLNSDSKYKGTGIGLAHCQKIIEMHGGTIWVESQEGKGSVFYFNIPN
jgi:signal transduction histidine kinase